MRRKYIGYVMVLLTLIMCLIVATPKAIAAEIATVEIPVSVNVTGYPPDIDEDFEIVFKANNSSYPMPSASAAGVYKMIITGASSAKLPEIEFPALGIYSYTISQTTGTDELCTYDESIYNIKVYITNAEDGSGLVATVIAYKASETDKLDEIEFVNDYEIEIPEEEIPGGPTDPPATDPPATDPPATDPPDDAPKTGDDTVIWPYIALFVGAIAVILLLTLTGKKKNTE